MELKVVIVDDEPDSINVLKKLLANFCPQIKVLAEATNITEGYEIINEHTPDAVFLDIQMPGGNGFELLSKFSQINFEIIFVTSYDKYAIDAIRLSALHYLLKPVETDDLQEAVKRIEKKIHGRETQLLQVSNAISNINGINKKITLHTGDTVTFVDLDEITHLESDRNYTIVYIKSGKKYISSKNLGEYEEILKEHPRFYRINKSCLVNVNHITNYSKDEPCILTIDNLHMQEVSRRKKQEMTRLLKL